MNPSQVNPSPGFREHPEHTITVEPFEGVVNVKFRDVVIASSDRAKLLNEKGHDPALYLPFEDIYFAHLEKTATSTHCPFKGDASYWSVKVRTRQRKTSCGPTSIPMTRCWRSRITALSIRTAS
jgi:uncharacterized protein (DUF427 family)